MYRFVFMACSCISVALPSLLTLAGPESTTRFPTNYAAAEQQTLHILASYFFPHPNVVLNSTQFVDLATTLQDTNGDGILSLEEVRDNDPYSPYLGVGGERIIYDFMDNWPGQADGVVHTSEFSYLFQLLDADDDGLLTEPEYKAEMAKVRKGLMKKLSPYLFAQLTNSDSAAGNYAHSHNLPI